MVYDLQFLTEGHFVHHSSDFHASDEHRGVPVSYTHLCRYIIAAPLAKLYGFTVNEEILDELERLLRAYLHRYVEKKMKTLQILDMMK